MTGRRKKPAMTAREWMLLADILKHAADDMPSLVGFKICETSARIIAGLLTLEEQVAEQTLVISA